jgi:hypothetical protein
VNPQTPLLPPNFTDPGKMQTAGVANPVTGQGTSGGSLLKNNPVSKLYGLVLLMLLFPCLASGVTTVNGKVQNLGTGNMTNGVFARFWLRGCAGNQPRVNGSAVIGPSQGGVFFFDLPTNSVGNVTGTLYSTRDSTGTGGGDIECGGSKTAVWYGMQIFVSGKGGPEMPIHAKSGGILDITQVIPITTSPVVQAPAGDVTYLRLDAANSPVTGNLQVVGKVIVAGINGDVYMDGSKYPSLSEAVAALPSGGTLRISAGTYTIPATLNMVSNLDIECSPNNSTILQASTALSDPVVQANGINHFRIAGCVIDGNRGVNTNQVKLVHIIGSSYGDVTDNHIQNANTRCVYVTNGSSYIRVRNNEISNCGQPLPATNGNEGVAVGIDGAGDSVSHVDVALNTIHDTSMGIGIYNGTTNALFDINVTGNRVYAVSNDGILAFSIGPGAPIQNVRVENNEVYCTGWPANGTGFSPNCTPGLFQTGSTVSSGGVGINMNSPLLDRPIVMGNSSHDNFYEGIDMVAQTITTVSTSGTTVTWVSGDPFSTTWVAGQALRINGVNYPLVSVAGANTTLTLGSSAGTQSNVPFTGIGYMRGTIVGNTTYNNGMGNVGVSGSGFSDSAYGNSWSGNVAYNNQAYGFIDQLSVDVTHNGDKAYNNDQRSGATGFISQDTLRGTWLSITADDSQAVPTQISDFVFSGLSKDNYVESASINATRVTDSGTGNSWKIGKTFLGTPVCIATTGSGGSYCVTGSLAGGAFTMKLPASNGTLSPLGVQDCGTTSTCAATDISATAHIVKGSVALVSGTPSTATVTGFSPFFSSTSSFVCTASNATTQTNAIKVVNASTSSITLTGPNTVTDTVNYSCIGN